jgi:hypothetical protein
LSKKERRATNSVSSRSRQARKLTDSFSYNGERGVFVGINYTKDQKTLTVLSPIVMIDGPK